MKKLALTIISLLGTALMASAQFGIVGAVGTLNSFEGMPVNNSSDKIYDSEGKEVQSIVCGNRVREFQNNRDFEHHLRHSCLDAVGTLVK